MKHQLSTRSSRQYRRISVQPASGGISLNVTTCDLLKQPLPGRRLLRQLRMVRLIHGERCRCDTSRAVFLPVQPDVGRASESNALSEWASTGTSMKPEAPE
jgi:hypothetical protein